MTKQTIKDKYWNREIAYDYAVSQLVSLGFTAFAADQFLFSQ